MDWIIEHYEDMLAVIGALVSLATLIVGLIARITPTTKDDEILGKIARVLDILSVIPVKK